jgi:hypothetical protein
MLMNHAPVLSVRLVVSLGIAAAYR